MKIAALAAATMSAASPAAACVFGVPGYSVSPKRCAETVLAVDAANDALTLAFKKTGGNLGREFLPRGFAD